MLVEQVNVVSTQTAQRAFHSTPDVVGAAVQSGRLSLFHAKAELCSYLYLIPERGDGFAHPLFAGMRPVHLSRSKERDTLVVRPADKGYHVFLPVLSAIIAHHRQAP